MGEFVAELTKRLREAQAALCRAHADGDEALAEVQIAHIENLRRLATRHDLDLPG